MTQKRLSKSESLIPNSKYEQFHVKDFVQNRVRRSIKYVFGFKIKLGEVSFKGSNVLENVPMFKIR